MAEAFLGSVQSIIRALDGALADCLEPWFRCACGSATASMKRNMMFKLFFNG